VRRAVLNLRDVRPVWAVPAWAIAEIRDALDGWHVVTIEEAADGRGDGGDVAPAVLDAVHGAEIYAGFGVPRRLFIAATQPAGSKLRWVHTATAGVGSLLYPELRDSDVTLTNSAGIHAEPMAESVIAMLLHFARGLDVAVRAQAAGEWDPSKFEAAPPAVREVAGATLGIIGIGGIGRAVAWRAAALGLRVIATRRRATNRPPEDIDLITGDDAVATLLARSDYVVLATPSTAQTRRMLGREQLASMKRGAVLINVARGDLVDETALADALRDGRLRGAALDVFDREPLTADSPLWQLPNVLITPHVSATSGRFWRRQTDLLLDNVQRYLAGQRLRNVVDKTAGY
jgi:phosphoglycerate dehydrogenase-like enzyme